MCEVNNRYGYYTVIEVPYKKEFNRKGKTRFRVYAKVKCDCGNIKDVRVDSLKSGHIVSCGCYNRKVSSEQKTRLKHGLCYTSIYKKYKSIRQRCLNHNHKHFKNYGGRGITLCDEWKDSFESFYKWCIRNGWKKELELDRRDNEKGYEPENCRFVTSEVNGNNKRNNIKYEHQGELLTLPQIARKNNIGFSTLYRRIHENKLPLSEALSIPLNGKCKKGPNPRRKLSYEAAIDIFTSTDKRINLCNKYGIRISTVDGIRSGKRYSDCIERYKNSTPS